LVSVLSLQKLKTKIRKRIKLIMAKTKTEVVKPEPEETQEPEQTAPARRSIRDSAYDAAVKEAKIDRRVGNVDLYLEDVTEGTWPNSGDTYHKYLFKILGCGDSKADLVLSPLLDPEELTPEALNEMDNGQRFSVQSGLKIRRQLLSYYDVEFPDEEDGIEQMHNIKVFAAKTKLVKGFVRVAEFRPKSTISAASQELAGVPF